MNNLIQIGVGLSLFAVISLIVVIAKKVKKPLPVILSLGLTIASLAAFGGGAYQTLSDDSSASGSEENISSSQMLDMANAFVREGYTSSADEILSEYDSAFEYDENRRLITARIAMLEGDYDAAYSIYEDVAEKNKDFKIQKELELAKKLIQYKSSDIAMIELLEQSGKNPADYGYTATVEEIRQALSVTDDQILDAVQSGIDKDYDIDRDYKKSVETVTAINNVLDGTDYESSLEDLGEELSDLAEDNTELYSISAVDELIVVCDTLSENYDKIVEDFARTDSPLRDIVVSELYINNLIDEDDVIDGFEAVSDADAKRIEAALSKLSDKYSDDDNAQNRIDVLVDVLDEDASAILKNILETDAENADGSDKSKLYLTIAKIDNLEEEYDSSKDYIQKSIDTATDKDDDTYSAAMEHIKNIVSNDTSSDTEDVKQLPEYIDMAISNTLPNDMVDIISDRAPLVIPDEEDEAEPEEAPDFSFGSDDGNEDETDPPAEQKPEKIDFAQSFNEQVIEVKSTVSIGTVDVSEFETVKAVVQISTDLKDIDKIKEQLKISDCGYEITDFEIKKLVYEKVNILLLCDVSGSMSEEVSSLRSSVKSFVGSHGEKESIAVAQFSDYHEILAAFESDDTALLAAADAISIGGGTNIYGSTLNCISLFEKNIHHNNVIIVMTDGEDNTVRSDDTIRSELGYLATENGVKVYTMGLGSSVDTNYLTTIASACQGDFIYVSDEQMLDNFYQMLHASVDSQYEISFTAQDTLSLTNRDLVVTFGESASDTRLYDISEELDTSYKLRRDLSVSGFSKKYIYKGDTDIANTLRGTGFKEEYSVSVRLVGDLNYKLDLEFVNDTTYSFNVPSGVAAGAYDVEVAIDGKKTLIRNGFYVINPDDITSLSVGPYKFTAMSSSENTSGDITLSGNVTMNNWLYFSGDVTFYDYSEDAGSVDIYDGSGSRVSFDPSTAEGVGKFLADFGIDLYIPAFGDLTLYNDPSAGNDYSNYIVDRKTIGNILINNVTMMFTPVASLYPDRVAITFTGVTTMLPCQDDILSKLSTQYKNNPLFKLDSEVTGAITDKNIGFKIDIGWEEAEDPEDKHADNYYRQMSVFGQDIGIDLNEFKLLLDTFDKKFELSVAVEFDFLKKCNGIMLGFGVSDFKTVDWFEIGADFDVNKVIHTVPVTFSNFRFKTQNIAQAVENHTFAGIKISGATDIAVAKVSAYAPALGKFLGDDTCLVELKDSTATLCFWPLGVTAETTVELFGKIRVAEAEAGVGFFDYSNYALGIDNENVGGIYAKVNIGVDEDISKNMRLALNGGVEVSIHSRFIGLGLEGNAVVDFKWWLLSAEAKAQGDIAVGYYFARNGDNMFIYTYKTQDSKGKVKGETYYLKFNGDKGKLKGSLT